MQEPFPTLFPYDVLHIIVSYVAVTSPRDLRALSATNSTVHDIAEAWIYKDVTIGIEPRMPYTPIETLLLAILRRAKRATYIRSLNLSILARPPDMHFQDSMECILQSAKNLKSLTIRDQYKQVPMDITLLTRIAVYSFRLTELTYHDVVTPEFWTFVESQPKIRRLVLSYMFGKSSPPEEHLSNNAIPELECIFAPPELLPYLCRGRPVKYISMFAYGGVRDLVPLRTAIASSSASIVCLMVKVVSHETFQNLLQELPNRTPYLRFLSLSWDESVHPQPIPGDCMPIAKLTVLECFRLRYRSSATRVNLKDSPFHPSEYAGPSLQCMQYEVIPLNEPRSTHAGHHEGVWQRDNREPDKWECRPRYFVSPPLYLSKGILVNAFNLSMCL